MRLAARFQKRITTWFLETACEAFLLSLLLIVLSLSDGPSSLGFIRDLAFWFFASLILFFTTGYLLTTAIADALWRSKRVWLYPFVASILFSLHLQIVFLVAGGWSSVERLPVRIAGPCIVFICTYIGSSFQLKQKPVSVANSGE